MSGGNDESASGPAYRLVRGPVCVRAGVRADFTSHQVRKSGQDGESETGFQSFRILAACCAVMEWRRAIAKAERNTGMMLPMVVALSFRSPK